MKLKKIICIGVLLLFSCGQIKKSAGTADLLGKAKKNIMTAESIFDLKRKDDLLKTAEAELKEMEAKDQKKTTGRFSGLSDFFQRCTQFAVPGGSSRGGKNYAPCVTHDA